jgi:integrase
MTTIPRTRRANGSGGHPWWNAARQQWEVKVRLADGTRRTVRGKTEREAERAREKLLGEVESGRPTTTERYTVAQYLDEWLVSMQLNSGLKRGTYRSYEMHVRLYLKPALGKLSLKLLSPLDVRGALIDKQLRAGKSPRLVQMMQAVLRTALSEAVRLDLVDRNVAKLVRVKAPDNNRYGRALSFDDAAALLDAAHAGRNGPLFAFLVTTGLRLGEALGLRWTDIDFAEATFNVTQTLQPPMLGKPWELVTTKTGRGKYNLPLTAEALESLQQQQTRQTFERKTAREVWRADLSFVFTNEIGEPLAQRGVQDAWKRALATAGLDSSYRIHDLRHTFATYLHATNTPQPTIMELMGHTTLAMTQRYAHTSTAMREDARTRMNDLWAKIRQR